MKFSLVYCGLLATLSSLSTATILLDSVPSTVHVNDVLKVTWSTDQDYTLTLELVQEGEGNVAWTEVDTIFKDRTESAGKSSFDWTVPSVAPSGSYGLYLSGENIPDNNGGYANLTNWFKIEGSQ